MAAIAASCPMPAQVGTAIAVRIRSAASANSSEFRHEDGPPFALKTVTPAVGTPSRRMQG